MHFFANFSCVLTRIKGVCLGHQAIIAMHGGDVVVTGEIKHGKTSPIFHDCKGVFAGVPSPFPAIRYHSLAGLCHLANAMRTHIVQVKQLQFLTSSP